MGQGLIDWDPVKTTCNMALARGAVVGDKMYVDGGEFIDKIQYQNGVDEPYRSDMLRWESECPSIQPA